MFNWFQKKYKRNSIVDNWGIDDLEGFEKIFNTDSIQYTKPDGSIVIYFSTLILSGKDLSASKGLTGEPAVTKEVSGWQFKGAKQSKNQILICVITIQNSEDVHWVRRFFDSIKPHEV
jgi:hypothetical protein